MSPLQNNIAEMCALVEASSHDFDSWLGDPDLDAIAPESREDAAFLWGYLQGIADHLDITLLQLVDAETN